MTENDQARLLRRACYSAPVGMFPASTPETALGALLANSEMAVADMLILRDGGGGGGYDRRACEVEDR